MTARTTRSLKTARASCEPERCRLWLSRRGATAALVTLTRAAPPVLARGSLLGRGGGLYSLYCSRSSSDQVPAGGDMSGERMGWLAPGGISGEGGGMSGERVAPHPPGAFGGVGGGGGTSSSPHSL